MSDRIFDDKEINEFAVSDKELWGRSKKIMHTHPHNKQMEYFKSENIYPIKHDIKILDIGSFNPFTAKFQDAFNVHCDNTSGDLDREFYCPSKNYDIVIFNNVIEHLMNPLFCLENIYKVLKDDGVLYILTPIKPHWITWGKGHFHEFERYEFDILIKSAGFKITDVYYYKRYTKPLSMLRGFRPFLRWLILKDKTSAIIKLIK